MKAIGIILAGGNNNRMKELTAKRAVPALPVAGSFRSIDFALSSMSNSHIQTVAVLTQYNARSLNEHLSSSKWWNFGRKQGGLFLFTPTVTADNSDWYRGTADAMYQNIDFLKRRHEPYVIISSGDCVYKLDFNRVLDFHIEKKSDITVVCKDMMYNDDVSRFGVVRMDDESRITEFDEKPIEASSNTISTGIYVIRRRQLIELLEAAAEENRFDFVNDILVRYKNVKKIYKTGEVITKAVDGIDFTVDQGEFALIIGASGAGKTTVLNILGGMDTATSGAVYIDGEDISKWNKKQLTGYRRDDIGFVFQFYNLVPNLTATENVELALQISKNPLKAEEVLKDVGLGHRLNNFPAQLSGGEQQRVSIARALAKNPKILLCDEPTGALDYQTGKSILKLLQDTCHKKGKTVVVITHNLAIAPMADRVI